MRFENRDLRHRRNTRSLGAKSLKGNGILLRRGTPECSHSFTITNKVASSSIFMKRQYAQDALKCVGLRKQKLGLVFREEDIIVRYLFHYLYTINSNFK
jgi:hypothetical protein